MSSATFRSFSALLLLTGLVALGPMAACDLTPGEVIELVPTGTDEPGDPPAEPETMPDDPTAEAYVSTFEDPDEPTPTPPDGEETAGYEGGTVIDVSPELYNSLMDGNPKAAVGVEGYDALMKEVAWSLPKGGGAAALCQNVTVPAWGEEGCAELWPGLLDGGSSALGAAVEGAPLSLSVEQPVVCGLGAHQVALTAAAGKGASSTCWSTVTICDPEDASCPVVPTPEPAINVDAGCVPAFCAWVRTWTETPAAATTAQSDAQHQIVGGVGPYHRVWLASQGGRSCWADDFIEAPAAQAGQVVMNANVLCWDANGARCEADCHSQVETQAVYRASVRAQTSEGLTCFPAANRVEANAQDEAAFSVNGNMRFQKAAAVQNGNEVATVIAFTLGGKVGSSAQGASADATIGMGVSLTTNHATGNDTDALNAFGSHAVPTPVTALLQSQGKSKVHVHRRVHGLADTRTDHWLMYYAGTSTCPGAGPVAYGRAYGHTGQSWTGDLEAANDFWQTRGMNAAFDLP